MKAGALLGIVCLAACSSPAPKPVDRGPPKAKKSARTLTIIATNDLHGAVDRLPLFAGFIANIRDARKADGGGVLLVDGGDMFQGTLESNLAEGTDVVRAYNAIAYDAVAIGNHEFDFGPEGPEVTAKTGEQTTNATNAAAAARTATPRKRKLMDPSTRS
jgi:5'-nucleotidase